MSDNQRDDNAERLRILRINHPTAHASPLCATCFLLAQIDARDTDLCEKDAEIEKLREFLDETEQERDKWFGLACDEQVSNKWREKQITEAREEIDRLRATPAAHVVEAAREALRYTMEMSKAVGISVDALNGLSTLQNSLAEYDAGLVAKEVGR